MFENLNYEIEEKQGSSLEISAEAPWDNISGTFEKSVNRIRSRAELPGFRRGMAPVNVIKQRFMAEIKSDFLEKFAPEMVSAILEKEGISPVTTPEISSLSLEENEPFKLGFKVETLPDFQLKKYKKLKLSKKTCKIEEKDVDKAIDNLRERNASLKEKKEVAGEGDFAIIEFKVEKNGTEIKLDMPQERFVEIGGREPLPGFDSQIKGMKKGETKEFEYVFPDDFGREDLRGESAGFTVTVKEVKHKQLPSPEELAESLNFKSVQDMRSRIRENMQEQSEQNSQNELEDQIVDELLSRHSFEVPEGLIEESLQERVRQAEEFLKSRGGDPSGVDRELIKERVEKDIRAGLVLSRIARQEGIEVTEEDRKAEEDRIMSHYGIKDRKQAEKYVNENYILTGKVFTFLKENAKIKDEKTAYTPGKEGQ